MASAIGPRDRLFPLSRQRCDQFTMKRYCRALPHLKHSIAMAIWEKSKQPGQIKSYLGHKSMASTMQYLNESDSLKAQEIVSALSY